MTSAQTWELSYQPSDLSTCPVNGVCAGQPDERQIPLDSTPPEPPQSATQQCRVLLTPALESAKLARDFTRDTLRDWQLDALVQEAVIIASELVTNAIRHGVCPAAGSTDNARVELAWQRHAGRLICVVKDLSAQPPVLAAADPSAESGRGLQVVQALAATWGWMRLGAQEKAVWAALLLP